MTTSQPMREIELDLRLRSSMMGTGGLQLCLTGVRTLRLLMVHQGDTTQSRFGHFFVLRCFVCDVFFLSFPLFLLSECPDLDLLYIPEHPSATITVSGEQVEW